MYVIRIDLGLFEKKKLRKSTSPKKRREKVPFLFPYELSFFLWAYYSYWSAAKKEKFLLFDSGKKHMELTTRIITISVIVVASGVARSKMKGVHTQKNSM